MKRRPAVQNSYTDSVGSRSSKATTNEEYDEIRIVPSAPRLCDLEYDVAREPPHGYANTTPNGSALAEKDTEDINKKYHTYQNIKGNKQADLDKNSKPVKKSARLPFGDFKQKKDQILSFFRRKNDSLAVPSNEKKPSNGSVTSYDHLNVNRPDIHLQVTPPPDDVRHHYAHTKTNVAVTEPKTQPVVEVKRSPSPKGVKAVDVGDSYIEFQFGTIDEDEQDLFKSKARVTDAKLMKPNRPPPKPASPPRLSKPKTPVRDSKECLPAERPIEEMNDQPAYDYADADDNVKPVDTKSNVPTSKESSVNLNSQTSSGMVYSYADVDDDENQTIDRLSPELVYEDIDEDTESSIRKSNSAQDISCDYSGGYEVPLKGSTQPTSHHVQTNTKPKSAVSGLENIATDVTAPIGLGNVVKELKEIQDLPDISDPKLLPNELKYSNLGLHTPKSKQNVEQKENEAATKSDTRPQNISKSNYENTKQSLVSNKSEEPVIGTGVLSLAKKFEKL